MSVLPHLQQNFKQGHVSQPVIKNHIYNLKREKLKIFMNTLKSMKELSDVIGENSLKELLFLISQDNATSDNILKCSNIYKKDRNHKEFNNNNKRTNLKRHNSL